MEPINLSRRYLRRIPTLSRASEYRGQPMIFVAATQNHRDSRREATARVDEWVELFSDRQLPLRFLEFTSRTPARLFNALRTQTSLEALVLKWGDYSDLSVLADMHELTALELRGASALTDLEPLRSLTQLRWLTLEGARQVTDLSPIASLIRLDTLEVGGGGFSDWRLPVSSLDFLRSLTELRHLHLHTLRLLNKNVSVLQSLTSLEQLDTMQLRETRPTPHEIVQALPNLKRWGFGGLSGRRRFGRDRWAEY